MMLNGTVARRKLILSLVPNSAAFLMRAVVLVCAVLTVPAASASTPVGFRAAASTADPIGYDVSTTDPMGYDTDVSTADPMGYRTDVSTADPMGYRTDAPAAHPVGFRMDASMADPVGLRAAGRSDGAVVAVSAQAEPQGQEAGPAQDEAAGDHGPTPPVWLVLPFVAILLMIATGPLFYPHHWHHHYPKYAVGLGACVALYYIFVMHSTTPMVHALAEYLSFIALVASLFIAASGIFLSLNARGTPFTNSVVLFIGSIVANLIATTGAAMLFIRPYMRLNRGRLKAYHIVFFIFLVANVGGALTPIGDPPLFLGFLRGVPFFWTLSHVWYVWLPTVLLLIGIFYVIDARNKALSPDPELNTKTVSFVGRKNFIWVAVVIVSVFIDPQVFDFVPELHIGDIHLPFGIREIIMFSVCVLAYRFANETALEKNEFSFEPIREVGWLFLGIFATMQPALQLISVFASENAEVLTVGTFYWATGALSGILDNAPTYLNFLAAAMGKFGLDVNVPAQVVDMALPEAAHPDSWFFLQAISVAAVFFGAFTYIGNAPNFMVKAIAESSGVDAPSFVAYIVKYSLPILLPVYFVIWLVFYSGWVF